MSAKKAEMPTLGLDKYKEMKVMNKKFISIREGMELYSMGADAIRDLAEKSGALYKVQRRVLINAAVFEEYLESFRVWG